MPVHLESDAPPFSLAELPAETLGRLLSDGGECVEVDRVVVTPVHYAWGSPATAGLWRVDVSGRDGDEAVARRFFVKLLRNLRLWPQLASLPEPSRSVFAARRNWRIELDMYESGIGAVLPPGMRTPELHHVRRHDDDYLALWWEFVDVSSSPWSVEDYVRTAYLLGRLAARRAEGQPVNEKLPEVCRRPWPSPGLQTFVQYRVMGIDVPRLLDPVSWQSPQVVSALAAVDDPTLPADLARLTERISDLLDRVEALPQTYAHGDASPQNLLIPADDPQTRVVIDWGLEKPLAVGFDLGQLLIGLAHADELAVEAMPAIEQAIVPAYRDGLATEGWMLDQDVVREGFVASLTCRSALSAIPFPTPGQPAVADRTLRNRLRLSRYLVDLAATLD